MTLPAPEIPAQARHDVPTAALLIALAFVPFLATMAPRAMVFLPGIIALVFLGFLRISGRSVSWPSPRLWAFVLWPIALGALSALWSADPAQARERAAKAGAALAASALLIPVVRQTAPRTLAQLGWILPAGVALAAASVALDLALGLPLHRAIAGVAQDAAFDPFHVNRSVVVCVLLLFPALGVAWACALRRPVKLLLCGGVVLCCAGLLVLCESQSAQLAFCCGVLMFALFPVLRHRGGQIALWALIAAFLCAAPFAAKVAFAPLAAAIESHEELRELSAPQRLEIWDFVARRALERPATGFGIDATRDMTFDTAQIYHQGNTVLHPHDFALQIWIEFGALGVACALLFFAGLVRALGALPEGAGRFAFAGFATTLSVAATGYGMWQGWWLGTLLTQCAWIVLLTHGLSVERSENQCRSDSCPSDSVTWSSGTAPSARSDNGSAASGRSGCAASSRR